MNRLRRRPYRRLDYKVLHTIGDKVDKEAPENVQENQSSMSDTEETPEETSRMATNYVGGLISQEATLDDITDYLDENPFEDFEDSEGFG